MANNYKQVSPFVVNTLRNTCLKDKTNINNTFSPCTDVHTEAEQYDPHGKFGQSTGVS